MMHRVGVVALVLGVVGCASSPKEPTEWQKKARARSRARQSRVDLFAFDLQCAQGAYRKWLESTSGGTRLPGDTKSVKFAKDCLRAADKKRSEILDNEEWTLEVGKLALHQRYVRGLVHQASYVIYGFGTDGVTALRELKYYREKHPSYQTLPERESTDAVIRWLVERERTNWKVDWVTQRPGG